MRYLAYPHPLGLAVITWALDVDYPKDEKEEGEEEDIHYFLCIDVYNMAGELVFEDGIGGCFIPHREETGLFNREVLSYMAHYFDVVEKQTIEVDDE